MMGFLTGHELSALVNHVPTKALGGVEDVGEGALVLMGKALQPSTWGGWQ